VEKARKEAESHAEEDKKKREAIDSKNQLENAIYQAEKLKNDNSDKLSEEDKKALDEAVEEAKKKLDSTDKEEIETATKELSNKIMPIGAKLYEQTTPPASDDKKDDSKDDSKEGPVEGEVVDEK